MNEENKSVTIQHTDNTSRGSISTEEVTHDQLPMGRYPRHRVSTEDFKPYEDNRYDGGPIVNDYSKYNTNPASKTIRTNESEVYGGEGELSFQAITGMTRNFRNAEPHDLVTLPGGMELKVEQALAHGMIVKTDEGYSLPGQPAQQQPQPAQKVNEQQFIELSPDEDHSLANETMQEQTEAMREHLGDDKYERYAELVATHDNLDDVIDALGDELQGNYDYAETVTNALIKNVVNEGLTYAQARGADREGFKAYLFNHPNQVAVKKAITKLFKSHNPAHLNEFINSYVAK